MSSLCQPTARSVQVLCERRGGRVVADSYLTPRAIADQLRLAKTDAVLAWIARGELAAVNISAGTGRPTWRISPEALEEFLARRRAVPAVLRPARRRKAVGVVKFF
jgi:hypothetical protein